MLSRWNMIMHEGRLPQKLENQNGPKGGAYLTAVDEAGQASSVRALMV